MAFAVVGARTVTPALAMPPAMSVRRVSGDTALLRCRAGKNAFRYCVHGEGDQWPSPTCTPGGGAEASFGQREGADGTTVQVNGCPTSSCIGYRRTSRIPAIPADREFP